MKEEEKNSYSKLYEKYLNLEKKIDDYENTIKILQNSRKKNLHNFLEILEQVSLISNLNELYKVILKFAAKTIDCEAGSIIIYCKNRKKLVFEEVLGKAKKKLQNKSFSYKKGVAGYSYTKDVPVIIDDVHEFKSWNKEFDIITNFNTKSMICCPISCKNKKYGVIQLINKKNNLPFTKDDFVVIKLIAHQTGIIISNLDLYNKANTRLNEINALRDIVLNFSSLLDLDSMLKKVVETVPKVFSDLTNFSIMLIDDETKELYIKSAAGLSRTLIDNIRFNLNDGLPGIIINSKKAVLINDAENDKRVIQHEKRKEKIASIMGAPLIVDNKILGILFTDSKKKNAFNNYNLELLSAFASHVSIAISNAKLFQKLKNSYLATINVLVNSIDAKDKYTRGHSERVKNYTIKLADKLNLSKDEIEKIYYSALLHDVGKIGISENIINKDCSLTDAEFEIIKKHPEFGKEIIKSVEFLLEKIPGVTHHHERYDGKGYPDKLKGENIPLEARIIAIADSFDAMTSSRSYRKKFSSKKAIEELKKNAGTQFDPKLIDIFIKSFTKKELEEIDKQNI